MSEQNETIAPQRTETRKAQGRAASQRHREAQKAKGIPDTRDIDTTIAAYLLGMVLDRDFHVPAGKVRFFVQAIVSAGGWDPGSQEVFKAVRRRCSALLKRHRSLQLVVPTAEGGRPVRAEQPAG